MFIFGIDNPACKLLYSKLCPVKLAIGFNSYSFIASSTAAPIFPISTPALTVLIAASRPAADASIISWFKFNVSSSKRSSKFFPGANTVIAESAIYPSTSAPKSSFTKSPPYISVSSFKGEV